MLNDGFIEAFGSMFNGSIPEITTLVEAGQITVDGVALIVTPTEEAYDVEISAINSVYTHMVGADVHNILTSIEQIDTMIEQMRSYQNKGYALILSSHHAPETQADVATKVAYLEMAKEIAESSTSAEAFTAAMNEAFPNYGGASYLEMSAGALFP